jgi:hypothetical protein
MGVPVQQGGFPAGGMSTQSSFSGSSQVLDVELNGVLCSATDDATNE